MAIITDKIYKILYEKKLNVYQLNKLMDFSEGALRKMISTKSPFSEKAIKKLIPILEITREEFESWVLADKYSKDVLTRAIQAKKAFPFKKKSILTTRLDEILKTKGISRTSLAKQINYSQSGLNRMITGQINMSRSVMEKIANVLGISYNEILGWSVADKYSVTSLESALNEL